MVTYENIILRQFQQKKFPPQVITPWNKYSSHVSDDASSQIVVITRLEIYYSNKFYESQEFFTPNNPS